ncbi:MAG: MarR family transcriptional regulator [Planctomycetota bacterium]
MRPAVQAVDHVGEPDQILERYEFGRAHHRIIYFVGRHPGITVSELLKILKVTKQSVSRVLSQLVREGYIEQETASEDRRRRLLRLTAKGEALERLLSEPQRRRIAQAYRAAGAEAVAGFRTVMMNLIDGTDRDRFEERSEGLHLDDRHSSAG